MKKKNNKTLNLILNVSIIIILASVAYGWMLTEPQVGETVDYNKRMIITDSDIEVKLYVLKDNTYVEQIQYDDEPLIDIGLMEPGRIQRYRFDITNNNSVMASTNIIFTLISGDVELLKDAVIFAESSPEQFSFTLGDRVEYITDHYSFDFYKEFKIPENSTVSLYWYIKISEDATNEIEDTTLAIDKIMFVKP